MLYSEVYGKLILLTKRNDITHVEVGNCIGLERRAIAMRAKRNAKIKDEELKQIESYFGINISEISVCKNALNKQNDTSIKEKVSKIGRRLSEIQEKNDLLDKEMAKILGMYEEEYIELKLGDKEPTFKILNRLKQYFEVSIDWLLYGD